MWQVESKTLQTDSLHKYDVNVLKCAASVTPVALNAAEVNASLTTFQC